MILFTDTETTGLYNFKLPPDSPAQPRIVQIAMLLCTNDGADMFQLCSIIEPKGFDIPENMCHGITTEMASKFGIDLDFAIGMFIQLHQKCDTVVGHNIKFDMAMINSEIFRSCNDILEDKSTVCTMLETTPICKIPKPNGGSGYKWPKLREAYDYFFPNDKTNFAADHHALGDLQRTKKIFFKLQELKMLDHQ